MKIIQTRYKGYFFRSRLEARWGVFFDSLGIKWEYEKEGFTFQVKTKDGYKIIKYLPDFWLPDVQMWAEVKPIDFNDKETEKAELLAKDSHHPVLMLIGVPENKPYYAIEYKLMDSGEEGPEILDDAGDNGYYIQGDFYPYPNPIIKECIDYNEYYLSNYHNYPKDEGRFYSNGSGNENFKDTEVAVNKARSKRFEFWENE